MLFYDGCTRTISGEIEEITQEECDELEAKLLRGEVLTTRHPPDDHAEYVSEHCRKILGHGADNSNLKEFLKEIGVHS